MRNKKTKYILCIYAVLALAAIVIYQLMHNEKDKILALCYFGWILLVFSLWSWHIIHKEILCPANIFLLGMVVFTYSQCLIYPFFEIPAKYNLIEKSNPFILAKVQLFTIICTIIYAASSLIGSMKKNVLFEIGDYHKPGMMNSVIINVGLVLIIISILPYLYLTTQAIFTVKKYGYIGLYTERAQNIGFGSIVENLSEYFKPGIICVLIGIANKSRLKRIFIYGFVTIIIFVLFYIGGRSEGVIFIMILILAHHYSIKKLGPSHILKLMVPFFVILASMSIIAETRQSSNNSISKYIETYKLQSEEGNVYVNAISEMGNSMFPLIKTMDIIPYHYPYRFGSTYFYALTSIIPNMGLWEIHPAAVQANLGDWLQNIYNLKYGPGFSLVAEAYINFGWLGAIFFLPFGLINGKIFGSINKLNAYKRPEVLCLIIVILSIMVKTNRNSFLETVRCFSYIALPIYFGLRYLYFRTLYRS